MAGIGCIETSSLLAPAGNPLRSETGEGVVGVVARILELDSGESIGRLGRWAGGGVVSVVAMVSAKEVDCCTVGFGGGPPRSG